MATTRHSFRECLGFFRFDNDRLETGAHEEHLEPETAYILGPPRLVVGK